ncbi:hypothetical protein NDA18_000096 [Ustilago nuda]|nr:hypothetical protein NDA18_000096 [Ustilago nuda]
MTETSAPVALLPPPVEISFGSTSSETPLPDCTANLMPFSIDYDGPAPINSFLVLRPASASDSDATDGSQSFISAFRGRAIQSTPLPLPAGYKAKLITVSQVAASAGPAAESSSRDTAAVQEEQTEAKEKEAKRQRLAKPPQTQQRFSMDSDDDDERNGFSQETSSEPPQPSASLPNGAETPKSSQGEARISKEAGPRIRIAPIAEVSGDELRLWGADGPIDKGDDTFVRTIAEWYSVVSPLSIKHLPGQGNGRSASRALKRYRADRTALERITKNSIRRLARRGGCKRIAGTVYEETRFILRDFLARTVEEAITYSSKTCLLPRISHHPRSPH